MIGPQAYHKINDSISKHISDNKKRDEETEFDTVSKFNYLSKIKNKDSKISSFLTIQEGCDKFCHFCVVPYTLEVQSILDHLSKLLNEAEDLIKNGTKEIILTGSKR